MAFATTPARVAVATGSVALVPVDESTLTTVAVFEPIDKFVATFTCAPLAIPLSLTLSAHAINPARPVVAAGIVAFVPVLDVTVPVVIAVL